MTPLLRLLDIRPAEVRPVLAAFGSLLCIVIAHTTLETVRDALFLVHVGPGALGYMYIVTAALTLGVGAISASQGARLGARRGLMMAQLVSAAGAAAFCFLPPTKLLLTVLYAFSAVSGALLVPQLWATTAALFHAGQGRRLFGTIAIAGVLGAVLGTLTTAGVLLVVDLRWLFLVSAAAFALSSVFIGFAPSGHARRHSEDPSPPGSWWSAFNAEPFLLRIALVVALGTATTLFADYLFKAVATARISPGQLGSFFARYYAAMNVLALVVQVFAARRVLARAGVVGTATLMPSMMLLWSSVSFASGGALFAVVGTRLVDGTFRHSVYRTGLELLYLAVPSSARDRARPIIDGAVTRLVQAAAAGVILLLIKLGRASPRDLAFVGACSALGWVAASVSLRGQYVALFRRALLARDRDEPRSPEELDLASVELLIEALGSARPRVVVAAIEALARRGRAGLVPALVLLRDEEDVLERGLELFGSSARTDWIHFCDRLLSDRRERVRRAAMRALARARRKGRAGDEEGAVAPDRPWTRGYLAIDAITGQGPGGEDPIALLTPDAVGREARLGMLTALSDAAPDARLAALLSAIVERMQGEALDRETLELLARAAAGVRATALVPRLIELLRLRDAGASDNLHRPWRGPAEGRGAVRAALVALGPSAFEQLASALLDSRTPRPLRMHLPSTLADYRSQDAADLLFGFACRGDDGLVRYRCLLGLERMVTDHGVRLPRDEVRGAARRDLTEHLRLLVLRHRLDPVRTLSPRPPEDARAIVVRLLDDKVRQALERVFRWLKLCFPSEDLHQIHRAVTSGDAATRANAVEFLDALLAPRRRQDHDGVRALLRLSTEDLPDDERAARAAAALAPQGVPAPDGVEAAIASLRGDPDALLATLAVSLAEEHAARPHPRQAPQSVPESDALLGILLRPVRVNGQ